MAVTAALPRLLPLLVVSALLSFVLAVVLGGRLGPPAAPVHLALAVGVMPLILGAVGYFTPVLTRGREAGASMALVPVMALLAALLAVTGWVWPAPRLFSWAALLALAAVALLMGWMGRRARHALGVPHPCLHWYLAALACLAAGLTAILVARNWPFLWLPMKRLHLHLNTLGFVGLTALGTLHVLLPTVAGVAAPQASTRLRTDLKLALSGVVLTAVGAAQWPLLSGLGLALWVIALGRLGKLLLTRYRPWLLQWHGAVPALGAAVAGFAMALALGSIQGAGYLPSRAPLAVFFLGFLAPLVTGAASYLLPVWLWPGRQSAQHAAARARLGRWSTLRSLVFLVAALAVAMGQRWGEALALAALAMFLAQIAGAWALAENDRRPPTPSSRGG